jgi:phosphatidylethanolamine-binding protein (PEBP) family uncharacterized protein
MIKKCTWIIMMVFFITAPVLASEFAISFDWGDIHLCTSGNPNTVANPKFVLSNVPKGTQFIKFTMTDLDVPSYNHGGGTIKYTGKNVIKPGAFKYKSPCPPDGSHRYRWTAVAKKKKSIFGGTIGKAKATKRYPK